VLTFEPHMKKYIGILALLVVGMVGYYFAEKKSSSTVDDKNFSLKNTDNITRISLEDRSRKRVVLTKKEDTWFVNNKIKAFAPKVNLFLSTAISKIRVKGPVPKTAHETTIRKMVGKAIHVRIYEGENLVRDYYVGEATPEQDASYLHINGGKVPYLAHILGYNSILYPKFSTDKNDWLDKTVFDYNVDEIESVEIDYLNEPDESFILTRKDSMYELTPGINSLNQIAAKSYFALFSFRNFEGYADYLEQNVKDSLKGSAPHIKVTVNLSNGKQQTLHLYQKKSGDGNTIYDKTGNPIVEDTERYFASFTGFPYLVTVQEYIFGKILVKRSYWNE